MEYTCEQLLEQERELQFNCFNSEIAWKIGSWLKHFADENEAPITVDITQLGKQLFHYSSPGTAPDNDEWVKRKVNLVYRMGHSSLYIGYRLKEMKTTIEEKYLLDEGDFAPHGGCFPVIAGNFGMIGTITVSGLKQEEDHALVVSAIEHHLQKG